MCTNKVDQVAGLIAYFIYLYGNKTPEAMSTYLQETAIKDVLSNIRAYSCVGIHFGDEPHHFYS